MTSIVAIFWVVPDVKLTLYPPQAARQENSDNNPEKNVSLIFIMFLMSNKLLYFFEVQNYKYNFAYSWKICKTIVIIVKNTSLALHKFPLFSAKGLISRH